MNEKQVIFRWALPLVLLAGLAALILGLARPKQGNEVRAQIVGMEPLRSNASFERITGPRELVLPRDHGPHPNFQTEWWYYTGNLQADDGRRFGYQLTFFRRAVQPAADRLERSSEWAAEHIYMAHFALTDVQGRSFFAFERFERGAAGLAGAKSEPAYQVWLRDWQVEQTEGDIYRLRATEGDVSIDLELVDRKGPVLQGDRGYSQKGPERGNASLYYSQSRLDSQGTITVQDRPFLVSGLSWLDREISTSSLGGGQVGWDWFSLQLNDGSELMVYVLRHADGTISEYSSGTYITSGRETVPLAPDAFVVTPRATWRSPHTHGVYPSDWTIDVPGLDLSLQVTPLLPDQELNLSFTYWEGAVEVTGARKGDRVAGFGFVELTGYTESLEGGL